MSNDDNDNNQILSLSPSTPSVCSSQQQQQHRHSSVDLQRGARRVNTASPSSSSISPSQSRRPITVNDRLHARKTSRMNATTGFPNVTNYNSGTEQVLEAIYDSIDSLSKNQWVTNPPESGRRAYVSSNQKVSREDVAINQSNYAFNYKTYPEALQSKIAEKVRKAELKTDAQKVQPHATAPFGVVKQEPARSTYEQSFDHRNAQTVLSEELESKYRERVKKNHILTNPWKDLFEEEKPTLEQVPALTNSDTETDIQDTHLDQAKIEAIHNVQSTAVHQEPIVNNNESQISTATEAVNSAIEQGVIEQVSQNESCSREETGSQFHRRSKPKNAFEQMAEEEVEENPQIETLNARDVINSHRPKTNRSTRSIASSRSNAASIVSDFSERSMKSWMSRSSNRSSKTNPTKVGVPSYLPRYKPIVVERNDRALEERQDYSSIEDLSVSGIGPTLRSAAGRRVPILQQQQQHFQVDNKGTSLITDSPPPSRHSNYSKFSLPQSPPVYDHGKLSSRSRHSNMGTMSSSRATTSRSTGSRVFRSTLSDEILSTGNTT